MSKRRGRPPAYDADAAIAQALDMFWTGGFAATSLDDLSLATGMNRPSLYGAFGDKRAMFLKALQAYRERGGGVMAAVMRETGSLADRLRRAYAAALDIYIPGGAEARGCFFTGAAMAGAVHDPDVRDAIRSALDELDRGFGRMFERAKAAGEIDPQADCEALGRLASSLLHTLSIRARAGTDRAALDRLAQDGVAMLVGAACKPGRISSPA